MKKLDHEGYVLVKKIKIAQEALIALERKEIQMKMLDQKCRAQALSEKEYFPSEEHKRHQIKDRLTNPVEDFLIDPEVHKTSYWPRVNELRRAEGWLPPSKEKMPRDWDASEFTTTAEVEFDLRKVRAEIIELMIQVLKYKNETRITPEQLREVYTHWKHGKEAFNVFKTLRAESVL